MLFWLAVFATIGNIETAALEDDGGGMNDTASFSLTMRAHGYRFLIKALLPLKMELALAAFVLVNGHTTPHAFFINYFTALASKEANN